jgi:UDPglucose--hexose-1-phosphate uridylyltransferase
MTIRVTPTHLADGREFFYFDDSPSYVSGAATRQLVDPRPLTDRAKPFVDSVTGELRTPTGPEMRLDVLTGDWIPMASHRMNRTFLPPADACPLCPADPQSDYHDGEIPDTDYDVAVLENRFPSYWLPPGQDPHAQWLCDGRDFWPVRHAGGRCEVVCFSSDHYASLSSVTEMRMRTIIEAWAIRSQALQLMDGIEQVYVFENRGQEIGVTLRHPHGQIYAYPHITPKTAAMISRASAYQATSGRHLLQDVLDAELAGPRLLAVTDYWAAYVPEAARWPLEFHLAPLRHTPDLPSLTSKERDDLASFYLRLLGAAESFFPADGAEPPLPYISGWHQAPVDPALRPLGRLHLQFFSLRRAPGKLKYLAGSESGMAAWISDTTPERIADRLRAALAELDQPALPEKANFETTNTETEPGAKI